MTNRPRIVVAQMGARGHYAVAEALHVDGMLARLYTDAYAGTGWLRRLLQFVPQRLLPASLSRFKGRLCSLPPESVTSFNYFGFERFFRSTGKISFLNQNKVGIWAGAKFGHLIIESGLSDVNIVYAITEEAEQLFEYCRKSGIKCVLEQCSPPRDLQRRIMEEELRLWPRWELGFETKVKTIAEECLVQRQTHEWQMADMIICPSDFVKGAVDHLAGQLSKTFIVPYGIDVSKFTPIYRKQRTSRRIRVLFVGRISLFKGVQYLLLAARALVGIADIRLVGPVRCDPEKLSHLLPSNVQIVGQVPRTQIFEHYRWADVFCLPSLFEGSALVTYEALAAGLPVICTENTGSVTRDGLDGFIVPIRNSQALIDRISRLGGDHDLLECMSQNACERAEQFDLIHYQNRLSDAIKSIWS